MLSIITATFGFVLPATALGKHWGNREFSFHLSSYTAETTDHNALCIEEFGATATVADWDRDLKGMTASEIKALVQSLDITPTFNTKYYFVMRSGQKTYGSDRVYFFERHDGAAPSNWLVHDQHGGLSLGSWYNIRGEVVCKVKGAASAMEATTPADSTSVPSAFLSMKYDLSFHLTSYTAETTDHAALCIEEFGKTATVADWDRDIKGMAATEVTALVQSLDITPTFNTKYYFVTRSGEKTYGSDRVYFFERHDGAVPGNWLVHDQHGGLSLGSWYGIRGQVVCKVEGAAISNNVITNTIIGNVSMIATVGLAVTMIVGVTIIVCIIRKSSKCSKSVVDTEVECKDGVHVVCVTGKRVECNADADVACVTGKAVRDKKEVADPAEVSALQQC